MKKLFLLFIPLLFIACEKNANIDNQKPTVDNNDAEEQPVVPNEQPEEPEESKRYALDFGTIDVEYEVLYENKVIEMDDGVCFCFRKGMFYEATDKDDAELEIGVYKKDNFEDLNYFEIKNLPVLDESKYRIIRFKYRQPMTNTVPLDLSVQDIIFSDYHSYYSKPKYLVPLPHSGSTFDTIEYVITGNITGVRFIPKLATDGSTNRLLIKDIVIEPITEEEIHNLGKQ